MCTYTVKREKFKKYLKNPRDSTERPSVSGVKDIAKTYKD